MRATTTLLFTFIFVAAFGQNSDTIALSADTNAAELAASTDLDSAALWALDDRLAKLDSEHVFRTAAQIKAIDTVHPLPLTDSIFEHYMAELDQRTPFEMTYNPIVRKYIERYLKYGTARLSRMMAHGQFYFPMFEEHLDKYDMPLEIKYLAVVESALNPKARSYVGATGLWQFMYSTGKMYDLKVNSYVDDRNDPLKSTEAACQYMLKMYDVFEDWNLSLIHISEPTRPY